MSDFCDSLDDENFENISVDSLEDVASHEAVKVYHDGKGVPSGLPQPFRLHNEGLKAYQSYLFPIFNESFKKAECEKSHDPFSRSSFTDLYERKSRLADIKSVKFPEKRGFAEADEELLLKLGLQRNDDGSFSKCTCESTENDLLTVPECINPESRSSKPNVSKKASRKKLDPLPKKKSFNFIENSSDLNSMLNMIEGRLEKGSSEEVLTSRGSQSRGETDIIHYKLEDNLTDSMKEELLKTLQPSNQSKSEKRAKSNVTLTKPPEKLLSTRSESKNLERIRYRPNQKIEKPKISQNNLEVVSTVKPKENIEIENGLLKEKSKVFTKTNHLRCEQTSSIQNLARKHKSDIILPSTNKPRLSYLERYQKEKGYDPLSLRLGNKPKPEDTNRSNYGDSATERLSEISSDYRKVNEDNDESEDEETFYLKWIQQEKIKGQEVSCAKSSNVTNRVSLLRIPSETSSLMSSKKHSQTQISKTNSNGKIRSNSSKTILTPIDMPPQPLSNRTLSSKSSHYCLTERTTVPKAELVSKARLYGHLANSRNLFKMKLQMQTKSNNEYLKSQNEKSLKRQQDFDRDEGLNLPFISTRIPIRQESFRLTGKEEKRKQSDNLFLPLINFNQNPGKHFETRSKS